MRRAPSPFNLALPRCPDRCPRRERRHRAQQQADRRGQRDSSVAAGREGAGAEDQQRHGEREHQQPCEGAAAPQARGQRGDAEGERGEADVPASEDAALQAMASQAPEYQPVADLIIGEKPLTAVVPDPLVLLQGNLSIVMLALLVVAITVGDVQVFGAGAWSWGLIAAAALAIHKLVRAGRQCKPWIVNPDAPVAQEAQAEELRSMPHKHRAMSLRRLYVNLGLATLTILLAGVALAASSALVLTGCSGGGSEPAGEFDPILPEPVPRVAVNTRGDDQERRHPGHAIAQVCEVLQHLVVRPVHQHGGDRLAGAEQAEQAVGRGGEFRFARQAGRLAASRRGQSNGPFFTTEDFSFPII